MGSVYRNSDFSSAGLPILPATGPAPVGYLLGITQNGVYSYYPQPVPEPAVPAAVGTGPSGAPVVPCGAAVRHGVSYAAPFRRNALGDVVGLAST